MKTSIVTLSQTGTGQSDEFELDLNSFERPFAIGFGVVVSGTVTYTVQHSFDGTNWFDHETVTGKTANDDGNYAFPIKHLRVNVTAGTGTATLTAIVAS